MDSNITRRRVVQGAGAVGVAGVVGSSVATSQEDDDGVTDGEEPDEQPAVRVAHLSPDAPNVDVQLEPTDDEADDEADEIEEEDDVDDDGLADDGEEATGGADDQADDGAAADGDPAVEDLGYGEVSPYEEVEAGSYRLEILPAEDEAEAEPPGEGEETPEEEGEAPGEGEETPEEGDVDESAVEENGDEADEADDGAEEPLYEEELEIEEGTTYTAVAHGVYAFVEEDDAEDEQNGAQEDDEDEQNGAQEDDEDEEFEAEDEVDEDREFTVEILEDDLADPGEETARLRVFHAVPDADDVSIYDVGADDEADEADDGDEVDDGDDEEEPLVEGLSYGEYETVEVPADDYTLEIRPDAAETDDEADGEDGEDVQETEISPASQTVYSGFAIGYFGDEDDPDQADPEGGEDEAAGGENGAEADVFDDEDDIGDEDVGLDDGEDGEREFEFLTVEDAVEGERSDGGTEDDELLEDDEETDDDQETGDEETPEEDDTGEEEDTQEEADDDGGIFDELLGDMQISLS